MTEKIVHQFDAYCKRVLQNEKIDYYRQKQYRMKHEVFISDLEEGFSEKYLVTNDTYICALSEGSCRGHCLSCDSQQGNLHFPYGAKNAPTLLCTLRSDKG